MPMVELDAGQKYSFGAHETFPIRYGWLKKAVDSVTDDDLALSGEDALVTLGVGKNMVRAIRHWALATHVVVDTTAPDTRKSSLRVTPLGSALLLDNGWDPFMEDKASLWLIHWHLVSELSRAAIWHLAFTLCPRREFTRDDMSEFAVTRFRRLSIPVTRSMIDRDVDCLIRTYVSTSIRAHDEEQVDCPLAELGLLQSEPEGKLYRFGVGPKKSLPAHVFAYALFDFIERQRLAQKTLSLDECLYAPGSPGQAFKLDQPSLLTYLDEISGLTHGALSVGDVAGDIQIALGRLPDKMGVLAAYYG